MYTVYTASMAEAMAEIQRLEDRAKELSAIVTVFRDCPHHKRKMTELTARRLKRDRQQGIDLPEAKNHVADFRTIAAIFLLDEGYVDSDGQPIEDSIAEAAE